MTEKKDLGFWGEYLVAQYLIDKGYKILEKNKQLGHKEVDLIASFEETLVFVEVKTRSGQVFGAQEAMDGRKISRLKRALGQYWSQNAPDFEKIRLDFIAVDVNRLNRTAKITHYKDIF